jgi:trehalose-6-phosphate synthase
MNLVAKEFVAAREDLGGVLVLSEMTGAAQELTDAILINPYHIDGFARAIERAIDMPTDERARRMWALRRTVAGRDVFRWASDILDHLEELEDAGTIVSPWRAGRRGTRLVKRLSGGATNVGS